MNRGRFQGTLNILTFNRKLYLIGTALFAVYILLNYLFIFPFWLNCTSVILFSYGLIVPIIVSAVIYDLSDFYSLNWLKKLNLGNETPTLNVNIHGGFDETSAKISELYPHSKLNVFDFYNPELHTEPAIAIARKKSTIHPSTRSIDTHSIPLPNDSVDNLFLIFSIHEIRNETERIEFLKECKRICKSNGKIIIVEHLRDLPNFLAFTLGFTHFFSKSLWRRNFESAGFKLVNENKFTSFVSIFILHKDGNTP